MEGAYWDALRLPPSFGLGATGGSTFFFAADLRPFAGGADLLQGGTGPRVTRKIQQKQEKYHQKPSHLDDFLRLALLP